MTSQVNGWSNSGSSFRLSLRGPMTSREPDVLLSSVQRAFIIKAILSPQQSLLWHDACLGFGKLTEAFL